MSKKTAHIGLLFVDVFAFFAIWLGYYQIHQVVIGISSSSDAVSFLNQVGLLFPMLSIPVFHIFALVEYFKPSLVAKKQHLINRAIIIFIIVLLVIGFFISAYIKNYVERAGYDYCRDASSISALFETSVYAKDAEACRRYIIERRERLGLPSQ